MMPTKETIAPLLLTKREAAHHLRVTERTIHNLIDRGLLPVVRFGSSVRIDRADLLEFIRQQREVAHA